MPLDGNMAYQIQNNGMIQSGLPSWGAYTTQLSDPPLIGTNGIDQNATVNITMPNPNATLTLTNTGNTVLTVTGPES